jgi:hypothetical protein
MKLPRISNPLFAISLAVVSVAAFAETSEIPGSRDAAPEWTDADSNRDGYLTKDELVSYPAIGQDFEKIDADGDNKITAAEYASWMDMQKPMRK